MKILDSGFDKMTVSFMGSVSAAVNEMFTFISPDSVVAIFYVLVAVRYYLFLFFSLNIVIMIIVAV